MIKKLTILSLIFLLVLQSCGTNKKSMSTSGEVEKQTLMTFKKAYESQIPKFQHLRIKSRLNADVNDKSINAGLKLYLQTDERIWANVSMFGITGARANITQYNVKAYEVLDKTYIDSDFSFFNEKLKVDFITFKRLNQLLLGQLFLIESWTSYSVETSSDNLYLIKYKLNEELKKKPQDGKYIHTFYLDSSFRLNKVVIQDNVNNVNITVNYTNWQQVEGKNLPGVVKILVNSDKTDKVELEYNNFDFSEMNPPFRIPSGYKEREL